MTKGVEESQNGFTSSGVQPNVVKVLEDSDFSYVKHLCDNHAGWHCAYDKKAIKVWTKPVCESHFNMIKARITMPEVSASTAYDVLHDPLYRPLWDKYMINATDIGLINPNNDVCYYAVGAMPPFRSRDFVMQRSWLDVGCEKFICSHSVSHERYPPIKGYIRGIVYLTAYYIKEMENGCQVTYVTHSDPRGKLPAWLINRLTKVIGPKVIKKMHKACVNYASWKAHNQPHWKPWIFPEQQADNPRINLSECQPRSYDEEIIDESALDATDIKCDENEDKE